MKKPVVFIIFNRPDTTAIVFEEIRKYQPKQLFVIGDGPRNHKVNEHKLCEETRSLIQVDWECEVKLIYSEQNLGCQKRIHSGLDEVFWEVEDAIILEDDCVPHEDFFRYCEELLDRYKNVERIMAISGNNFQEPDYKIEDSYYFSSYPHCWGWATWRRAWSKVDIGMKEWHTVKESKGLHEYWYDKYSEDYWTEIFNRTSSGEIDSWAYPWLFSCWNHNGLAILPKYNLVSNIGFGENSTHTNVHNELLANLPIYSIEFPLVHPAKIKRNFEADYYTTEYIYGVKNSKNKSIIESSKIQLLNFLMDSNMVHELFQNDIYIFGTGNLGRLVSMIFKAREYTIKKFIVSNLLDINTTVDKIPVIGLKDLDLKKKSTVIVTIEGEHDIEVMKELRKKLGYNYINIISWKQLINEFIGKQDQFGKNEVDVY